MLAAPQLRPRESSGGHGGRPTTGHPPTFTVLPIFVTADGTVDNQEAHDLNVLPHMYAQDEMDRLFPVLDAPPPGPNIEDWQPPCGNEAESKQRITPTRCEKHKKSM